MKKVIYWLEMVAFTSFGKVMRILPERVCYLFATALGMIGYYLLKKRRLITLKNVSYAFPELKYRDWERIAKQSYISMAMSYVEFFWSEQLLKSGRIIVDNPEILDDAVQRNKGVVMVSLHIGNWELGCTLGSFGYKLYDVARRQNNPFFNKIIEDRREKNGLQVVYKGEGARKYLQIFKREKAIIILPADQHDTDIPIVFFGKQTTAPRGPAVLAVKFNAPMVLTYVYRDANNNHHIKVDKEIAVVSGTSVDDSVQKTMQSIYREYERVIREHPEQYFWVHNRFKK